MMDMQMLGMMNYITSIMRWQNAGRGTAGRSAGNHTARQVSFEERLRQSVRREITGKTAASAAAGRGRQRNTDSMEQMMQMMYPYQNLAMLGLLTGNYGGWNIFL